MLFAKIKNLFSTKGGDLIIFIISLLLAFFMWSIQKLSQDYISFLKYNVTIQTTMPGRAQLTEVDDVLVVRGKASGFYILRHLYTSPNERKLIVNADTKIIHELKGKKDYFFVKSNDLKNAIQEGLGADFQLENIATDTMLFKLPKQVYKNVPIVANTVLTFKNQYMAFGNIVLKPDSILIYGNNEIIKNIDYVSTNLITGDKLDESISGIIKVKEPLGVDIAANDIFYSMDISRYVEESVVLRINIINLPPDKNIIFLPKEVRVKYRMKFESCKQYLPSDFYAVADYKDMINALNSSLLKVNLYKKPKNIWDVKIDPPFVELIESK